MTTSYPGAVDSLLNPTPTTAQNSLTLAHASQHANANDALEAIEAELGTAPSGVYATVKARLDLSRRREFWVDDDGAVSGATDNAAALQTSLTASIAAGGDVRLPAGSFNITTPLTLDLSGYAGPSDEDTVNIFGSGSGTTELVWTGGGAAGANTMLTITGTASLIKNSTIRGFRLQGNGLANGIRVVDGAFMGFEDLFITGCDVGFIGQDFLSNQFTRCRLRFNRVGMDLLGSGSAPSSPANAIEFFGCDFGLNSEFGLRATSASGLRFYGGTIQGNGTGVAADRAGAKLMTPSVIPTAAAFYGTWFENNAGKGDVWMDTTTTESMLSFHDCNFDRIDSDASKWGTNNILVDQGVSDGTFHLHVQGCSFKGHGTYSADAARQYIKVNANAGYRVTGGGNSFASTVEATAVTFNEILAKCVFAGTAGSPTASLVNHNVASITKNSTGDYSIAFHVSHKATHIVHIGMNGPGFASLVSQDATSVRIRTLDTAGVVADFSAVMVTVSQ